jgi:transposase
VPLRRDRRKRLEGLQTGDGRPLPANLKVQVSRELDRLELLLNQINAVEAELATMLAAESKRTAANKPCQGEQKAEAPNPVAMLLDLKGISTHSAAILWTEGLSRTFANRRQLAAYAGLAATPWQSGTIEHEQGLSKAGNPRLRTLMVEIAWLWRRHQPQSALTKWFKARGERGQKVSIIALARKLLVALWKYVTQGVVIEGAVLKTAV